MVEVTYVSIDGWTNKIDGWSAPPLPQKMCVEYTYNGIVFSLKNERDFDTYYNRVNLGDIMLGEISQPQKDKYHTILFI